MAGFVFGVMASPNLKVRSDTSKFTVTLQRKGDPPVEKRFALAKATPADLAFSHLPQDKGRVLSLFRFSDKTKAEIHKQQALWRDLRSKSAEGVGIGIGVEPNFCKTSPIDYSREKFNLYIAPGGSGELMTLVENMSIKDLLGKTKQTEVPNC